MKRNLIRIMIITIMLIIMTSFLIAAQAAPAGWFGTCRIAPVVEHDGEIYRVRCNNGEIRPIGPEPRATWDARTPTPERTVIYTTPYPGPK